MFVLIVVHSNQRGCVARDLGSFGDHKRNRLAIEHDPAVVQRPVWRAVRCHLVLVGLIAVRHWRTVVVGQYRENTTEACGGAGINAPDATLGNGGADNARMGETLDVDFGGILCAAGDLGNAVDARGCGANVGCHDFAHAIFLWDCDCGVPRAACESARTIARRARSILKVLCPKPLASPTTMSAAWMKVG